MENGKGNGKSGEMRYGLIVIFRNIMVATDGSELAKKAVDSAIKIARLNNAKLYAVHVIAPGETSVTLHDPRDAEWKKAMKEHLEAQGREATAYVETSGKIEDVDSRIRNS